MRVFLCRSQQPVRIIAHDSVHSGGDQHPHVRGMIHRPAHHVQIFFLGLRDQRRRHQVTAHDQLPCADSTALSSVFSICPSYSSPVISVGSIFRKFSTMAASNESPRPAVSPPNHATRQSMRALRPTRFPVLFPGRTPRRFFWRTPGFLPVWGCARPRIRSRTTIRHPSRRKSAKRHVVHRALSVVVRFTVAS